MQNNSKIERLTAELVGLNRRRSAGEHVGKLGPGSYVSGHLKLSLT
ncbi:MAG: hypothetical protein K8R75_01605 [Deltaproteobacteria bacterium]|nr:hypothetical protein [Deltaproteobacteria bacterium]